MAHKTLIGGTAYNISSGKSLVSGTTYSIKGGKTLIGGTGYSISFGSGGEPTAMLYSDGDFVFQHGNEVASGKTLTASYTGFEDTEYTSQTNIPWNSRMSRIKNVSFNSKIKPINIAGWFNNARNLLSCNWTNFDWNNVTNMYHTCRNCRNLTGSPVCGNNVTNMYQSYYGCSNLTGSPVCGNKVVDMSDTYDGCSNLTGSPVCGNNVTNMANAYWGCRNLTGSPVCGNKVTSMGNAYYDCRNLTGSPVCGNKVTNMANAYFNCVNITGSPACGSSVTDMANTYKNCKNLNAGTFYFYSKNVADARNCFYGKNNSRRYNIHVPANSTTFNTFIINNTRRSLVGATITWTNNGTCWYNTTYNIYIYANTSMA